MKPQSALTIICLLLLISGAALAGPGTPTSQTSSYGATQSRDSYSDSLLSAPEARGEHPLQYYLDSLGYDIDVIDDELGWETFCGIEGINSATMIIEVAGSAVYATSGYYQAGDTSTFYQLFGPSNGPGDSVSFSFDVFDSVGFYMKPHLPGDENTWLTENSLNWDGYDHAWVFATGVPHEYLIAWEDLPHGGDEDYQDLVIRIRFANFAPELILPDDYTAVQCSGEEICLDITAIDANCQGDSIWLDMLSGYGSFSTIAGVSSINAGHCFTPPDSGSYEFVFAVEDIAGAMAVDTIVVHAVAGAIPTVEMNDTALFLCEPTQICIPVTIYDPDCDIVSVTPSHGTYTATMTDFDQIERINVLGGSVVQIGGGAPGTTMYTADDFVPPVNSQSGVQVTMPGFTYPDHVINYGSFPSGTQPANSPDHLLGPPTDLTFTAPGAGGPDGGSGDGSVYFEQGNRCVLGFANDIVTCHGAGADMIIFTNTGSTGTCRIWFKKNGQTIHIIDVTLPGNPAASGIGGLALDLPDGMVYNQIKVNGTSGNFEIDAFAVRSEPGGSTTDVCFWADTAGIYEIVVTAEDSCGAIGADTALVTVNMNSAPVVNAGNDFTQFVCELGQLCFYASISDPDDNIALTELVSGPGTLNGEQVCFTPTIAGAYTFVLHAVDSCGLEDYDTVIVTVAQNNPPVADNPPDQDVFQCVAAELCYDFTATDDGGGPLTWTHMAGVGSIDPGGHFCFTPTISGAYAAGVIVADSCGAVDTAYIHYDVVVNQPPVLTAPATPIAVFQCEPAELCYQFTAADPESGPLSWNLLSGDGDLSATGKWCVTPSANGDYSATIEVADSCGAADTTTLTYEVTLNAAPEIAFGADTSLLLCGLEEICLAYTVDDPNGGGGLVEQMVSGHGHIDTLANEVCFTPAAAGDYEIVVGVTDSCGLTDEDTILVTVAFGDNAVITCPTQPIDVFLCQADTVCQSLGIAPSGASVTVSEGVYDNGQLCFLADTAGTYDVEVIAEAECGSDTCVVSLVVELGQVAQIDCPEPASAFICAPGQVCIPVGVFGTDVTTVVSPIGSYQSGSVCFPADTSGHYELTVVASGDCGTDTCLVEVDVTINSAPLIADPESPVDTFLCSGGQVCYQFDASDPDGGDLTFSRLTGNGSVTANGLWCFNALATGSKNVTVMVADSCGASDTTALTANVTVNSAPVLTFEDDTTLFACVIEQICRPFVLSDADDNITSVDVVSGDATMDLGAGNICFMPVAEGTYQFVVQVTDACGASDIDTVNYIIDLNQPPLVDAGPDQTVFQCETAEICWSVSASDPDGNLASVEMIDGPGSFAGGQICFTPTGTYNYEWVLRATDDCGLESFDTVAVYYTLNTPPVADAGADQTVSQCEPAQICWSAGGTDVDGNLSGLALVSGPGSYDGGQICFTPAASGINEFVLQASDDCSAADLDTATINVTINSAPVCVVPPDTSIFQCAAEEVCLPAYGTDADGNLDVCQIISGPGALVNGNWCYELVSDQAVTVVLHCEDSCGAVCQSQFTVEFDINGAPQVAFGPDTSLFLCASEEICLPFTASDPDSPRPTTLTLVGGSGALDIENSEVCYTPIEAGTETFIIRIEDECGAFDEDTINVTVALNSSPVANAGDDQSLFLCDSVSTVCWPASCSDPDGNLSNCQFNGPGSYDGSEICFNPVVSGFYTFTLRAVDDCGLQMTDTVTVEVTLNADPVVAFGADTSVFLCAPQEICVAYTVDDANGLSEITEGMVSGFGVIDTAANTVCFTPSSDGSYEIVVSATDSCGAAAVDTIVVDVAFGEAAAIDCPAGPFDRFLCGADSVIQALAVSPSSATVDVSGGIYDDGAVRFLADTAGVYAVTVIAGESCGADTCELTFNVLFNAPPVANAGSDQSLFQCAPTQVCWPASCTDPDGNLSTGELVGGIGGYNGSQICFTPSGTDSYEFVLRATDQCGVEDYDTVTVDVTLNSAPTVVAQADTSVFQCDPTEVCVAYVPGDSDGLDGLIEEMAGGFGTIDTAANTICFTPTSSGDYELIVMVTDDCGATAEDTALVSVMLGENATIACPPEDIDVFLCQVDSIHQTIDIAPDSATVTVSYGVYSNGELTFLADSAGTYIIDVIAELECGADTCRLVFNVDIGQAAQINCPQPSSRFLCQPGNICMPLGVQGTGASVTVDPIGAYSSGNLCFPADTAGYYEITVIAETDCGVDTCVVEVDVTFNSAPVLADPASPVDTFMCGAAQVCYQFDATDADNQALVFSRVGGNGSVTSDGLWCFNTNGGGVRAVQVAVTDECGAADTTSLTYNATINASPVVTLPGDTSLFICEGESWCFDYNVADTDDNIDIEELLSGVGAIDTLADEVCFTPTASGDYQFIVGATDACGAFAADTINISVTIGSAVTVACPADTAMFLCGPQTVCRPVSVSQSGAAVTVLPSGAYDAGQVCFSVDTAGHYELTIVAESTCGADTCGFAVDVSLNSPPIAVDPASPVDTFLCDPAQITCQFDADDVDGQTLTWTRISGNGSVSGDGIWTFTASTAGAYSVCATVADPCGAADTVCLTYNVTLNASPQIAFTRNEAYFLCQAEEICLDYTTADADDNIILEELISGFGLIDTVANQVCFTPDTSGVYSFEVQATDGCGDTDTDAISVTVTFNRPPVVDAGSDRTIFQCSSEELCWPGVVTDPDDNIDSIYIVSAVGAYTQGNICFTPDTAGVYVVILRAVDACGLADEDTVNVEVQVNQPPVCQVPSDTSFFQCTPSQISLPVSGDDPDGNFDHCELLAGPGSISGGQWKFTPSSDQSFMIKVLCLDECGASCIDSFNVAVEVNARPVVNIGPDTTFFVCEPGQVCWPVSITDDENNVETIEVVSENGSYNETTGDVCLNVPAGERNYRIILEATDECGVAHRDTAMISIDFNAPPTLGLPPDFIAYLDEPGQVCFDVHPDDEDGNLGSVSVGPIGTYSIATEQVCFDADSAGIYCFEVTAGDNCGAQTVDSICIEVVIDECIHVQIEKTHNAIQGQDETVRIFLNGSGKDLGGYDMLVAYDQSALSVRNVAPGNLHINCGWEYFNFRGGANGNCDGCPSGLLRIVAIAETNNGAYHPGCFLNGMVGSLADIDFLVSDDRTLECQYAPVRFFWTDCGDNAFSSRLGDTLWISRHVYDLEHNDIADNSYGFPGWFGAHDTCLTGGGPGKPAAIRCVDFTNGGIDIVCADSIDARADINLNGQAWEIADAVLFSNYFIHGLSVFTVNVNGQIAATDVNADGLTLSVADLVMLIRVVVGDAPAVPKLSPGETPMANLVIQGDMLYVVEADLNIGAISMTLSGDVAPTLAESARHMQLRYNYDGENTRVLIYNMNGQAFLEAGEVLDLKGSSIVEIDVGSYEGLVLKPNVNTLPRTFSLSQNYPNPFNPTTTFHFGLPQASDWKLSIFNLLGQTVRTFEGHDEAGYVTLRWDASRYASGIYFYRLRAGDYTATRKMVLLK